MRRRIKGVDIVGVLTWSEEKVDERGEKVFIPVLEVTLSSRPRSDPDPLGTTCKRS